MKTLTREINAAPTPPRGGRITLQCTGGLGNQMFAYAAGCYFAARLGCALEVVRPLLRHQSANGFGRPFHLDRFCISAPVRDTKFTDRIFFSANPKLAIAQNCLGPLLGAERIAEAAHYHFDPPSAVFAGKRHHCYLTGYWQAAAYVEEVREQLRREFRLRAPLAGRAQTYAGQIARLACPVAVHIRIGDYAMVNHRQADGSQVSQILRPGYYERVCEQLRREMPGATLVVFSDEPAKARERLRAADEILLIESGNADYEDLSLMSLCHHQVIANSSFSWWAAWLNQRPGRQVFAPRYWGNMVSTFFPDLFPDGWRIVDNL